VEFKRHKAIQLGATAVFESMEDATELARSVTNGQGADSAIVAVGVVTGEDIGGAFSSIRKGGTVVVVGMANFKDAVIPANLFELVMFQKRIQGALFGMMSRSASTPFLLGLYQAGQLKLDELITRRYSLETSERPTPRAHCL